MTILTSDQEGEDFNDKDFNDRQVIIGEVFKMKISGGLWV
jgi:hypothetical protein